MNLSGNLSKAKEHYINHGRAAGRNCRCNSAHVEPWLAAEFKREDEAEAEAKKATPPTGPSAVVDHVASPPVTAAMGAPPIMDGNLAHGAAPPTVPSSPAKTNLQPTKTEGKTESMAKVEPKTVYHAASATAASPSKQASGSYVLGASSSNACPDGAVAITSQADCEAAATASSYTWKDSGDSATYPGGCYLMGTSSVYYNLNTGAGKSGSRLICEQVEASQEVSVANKQAAGLAKKTVDQHSTETGSTAADNSTIDGKLKAAQKAVNVAATEKHAADEKKRANEAAAEQAVKRAANNAAQKKAMEKIKERAAQKKAQTKAEEMESRSSSNKAAQTKAVQRTEHNAAQKKAMKRAEEDSREAAEKHAAEAAQEKTDTRGEGARRHLTKAERKTLKTEQKQWRKEKAEKENAKKEEHADRSLGQEVMDGIHKVEVEVEHDLKTLTGEAQTAEHAAEKKIIKKIKAHKTGAHKANRKKHFATGHKKHRHGNGQR